MRGHKYVTFVSGGRHAFELPRFLVVSAAGLAVVSVMPAVLTDMLGLPAAVPILLACVVIPAVNYVVLGRWVFAGAEKERRTMSSARHVLRTAAVPLPIGSGVSSALAVLFIGAIAHAFNAGDGGPYRIRAG